MNTADRMYEGKTVPLQAWSGPRGFQEVKVKVKQSRYRPGMAPEGSRKLRFSDFMTTAQDGGKVVSLTHRQPLPSGNTPGTHFC
jgi:hypothetical protein